MAAVLLVVLGGVVSYITTALQRSKSEEIKVDLTQEGRSFVDEFERDIHQSGYPNCRMFNFTGSTCSSHFGDSALAAGLVSVSSTQIIFEGDVDGDGVVDSVRYQLVDSAGNSPPTGTCPCTMQRSQLAKITGNPATGQSAPIWSQELQGVVNSGSPAGGALYGGGLPIAGNVLFGSGSITNTAYYAAVIPSRISRYSRRTTRMATLSRCRGSSLTSRTSQCCPAVLRAHPASPRFA